MPAGAGNPPNIKMDPPKSNFNIRGRGRGGGGVLILGGRDYNVSADGKQVNSTSSTNLAPRNQNPAETLRNDPTEP